MTDFLLELRSEEIPARMQAKARDDLARLFAQEIGKAGLKAAHVETLSTPRRLALIARDLPDETQAVSEERKGPRATAPEQALAGFLRSTGLTREQLIERDGVFFATLETPGRATAAVLAEAIPTIVRAFPWPKSMRWGAASVSTESPRWVRPLQGVVALFGEEIVEFEIAGVTSGAATLGHRFHHPGAITIGGAGDYIEKLRACHVIVDHAEREALIREGARAAAEAAGLELVADEGLVVENAGLTEWPMPLLGRFDDAFLSVPPEVIRLTMRTNQKYFACADEGGALADAFICTANIDASDGGAAIIDGNRKVLAARLADARFFYEADLKTPLDDQAAKLSQIVFHEKLGTVADKVERVAKLARWLCEEGIVKPLPSKGGVGVGDTAPEDGLTHPLTPSLGREGELANLAERAARLCKADLVTAMVGEFPELQGIIGGHLARAQGEDARVADAIRDHYKPVGQGDAVPTDPVTVAVSLADKLDTLYAFFAMREFPTGSRDPFALRRAALGVIGLLETNQIRLAAITAMSGILLDPLYSDTFFVAMKGREDTITERMFSDRNVRVEDHNGQPWEYLGDKPVGPANADHFKALAEREEFLDGFWEAPEKVIDFLIDRLKVQQREAGVRHDLIDAVFALGGEDDLVRLLARVRALQGFVATGEGADLLAAYKRAANILKKEGLSPLPFRGGEGGGDSPRVTPPTGSVESPHPNPSPEGEGLEKSLSYSPEPVETALIAALDSVAPSAADAVAREDFEAAMQALSSLREPIDAFFELVTVNDPDADKRAARLALLARFRDACHRVADFSRIEG